MIMRISAGSASSASRAARRLGLVLALVLGAAALVACAQIAPLPALEERAATAPAPAAFNATTPAGQAYLRAHEAARPADPAGEPMIAPPLNDAGTAGALGYIQAHEAVPAVAAGPIDPAQQSVLGYIQAHEAVAAVLPPLDAAQQGVMGYIRAHEAVPAAAPTLDPAPPESAG